VSGLPVSTSGLEPLRAEAEGYSFLGVNMEARKNQGRKGPFLQGNEKEGVKGGGGGVVRKGRDEGRVVIVPYQKPDQKKILFGGLVPPPLS
jgi:hypothetical protein